MKISLSVPFLLLVFLAYSVVCYVPVKSKCPLVRLVNGRVRSRFKGRIIRFSCYEGFSLIGNKYSTCIRGQWDTPTPVCVNAECTAPQTPDHALVASKYNGAVLIYFCEPGYALIGPAEIICDGKQWNGTTPHCRDTNATPPIECDFEKPDLCWWEQDPRHDFDWVRHNFDTPSSHIGTGPSHDHTLGPGNDGYYLYIEASGRLENDTARIISPIYNASYTDSGCFSFWYHMYGATIGTLNVYFKKEKDLMPRLMFTKVGDQGNRWLHGIFDLPKADKGFQIIIEGIRGHSYVSDIAIDDVAILQGEKCRNKTETDDVNEGDNDQVELVNAQQSCRGRCKNSVTYNFTTSVPPTPSDTCLCTLDCAEHSICCPDYAEYCVLSYTEESTAATEQTTIPNYEGAVSVPTKRSTATDVATVRTGFSMNPKDDIDPITLRPWTTTNASRTSTIATTTKKVEKTTTKKVEKTTTKSPKETPFVQPISVTAKYAPLEQKPGLDAKTQEPEKLHREHASKFSLSGIIGLSVGIVTGVSISFLVVIMILKRRKTYKRGTKGALSEDSDVRFLTSDEILDFTLARPIENEETSYKGKEL